VIIIHNEMPHGEWYRVHKEGNSIRSIEIGMQRRNKVVQHHKLDRKLLIQIPMESKNIYLLKYGILVIAKLQFNDCEVNDMTHFSAEEL
jgi:hypothetical protein